MEKTILKIDNRQWTVVYDFNAIAEAEPIAGCNLLAALENLQNLSAGQLRGLLYAAIVEPPATLEEAGRLIRMDTIATVTSALADAYKSSINAESIPAAASGESHG